MGPMMDGWQGGGGAFVGWLAPALVVMLVILFAVTRVLWHSGGTQPKRRRTSPEETLRVRYAQGELTRQQYQEALEDILKDRYVRGEVTLEEFEKRLDQLVGKERSRHVASSRSLGDDFSDNA